METDYKNLPMNELLSAWEKYKVRQYEFPQEYAAVKAELADRNPTNNYRCKSCGHPQYEEHEMRTAGGLFSSLTDVETQRLQLITCKRCLHSEIYRYEVGYLTVLIDLLGN